MSDVCVVGHVTRDVNKIDGEVVAEGGGGVVVYGGLAYRRLGLETEVVTKAAAADVATLLWPLRDEGIAVRCLEGETTTSFENDYDGGDLRRRVQTVHAIAPPFRLEDLDGVNSRIVHLGPLTPAEMSGEFIRAAADHGGRVLLDAQGLVRRIEHGRARLIERSDLGEALSHIDILKADADEARALSRESGLEASAHALGALGPREVILTFGDGGALIWASGAIVRIEPVASDAAQDPTGCGDSFACGYAFARDKDLDVRTAGRFAAALATLTLETKGPFAGSLDDVWARSGMRPPAT